MGLLAKRREKRKERKQSKQRFDKAISEIYKDAKLNRRTLKLLKNVWEEHPELIKNAYRLKLKTYGSDVEGAEKLEEEGLNWADKSLKETINKSYKEAPKVAYYDLDVYEPTPVEDYSGLGSFANAFRTASSTGADTFYWDGTEYTTEKDPNWRKKWGKKKQNSLELSNNLKTMSNTKSKPVGTVSFDEGVVLEGSLIIFDKDRKIAKSTTIHTDPKTGEVKKYEQTFIRTPDGKGFMIQPKIKTNVTYFK